MDRVNIMKRAETLDMAPKFAPYSRIIIHVDKDTVISVGDDTGLTLEYEDPFGTKAQAEAQLKKLKGYQYQPYKASNAFLDPSAEIGDAASIKDLYGGIYNRSRTFSRAMRADISAPHDEEIDHEFQYKSPTERKFEREVGDVRASLLIQSNLIQAEVTERKASDDAISATLSVQASEIAAKVSQQSPEGQTTFSWKLAADSHKWYANNSEVMSVDKNGLKVVGEVQAKSGKIGNFNISASAIWSSLSKFGGTQKTGVYIGTDGIQLGQNFKVDATGNLTAASGSFSGAVKAGSIQYGGNNGTLNGAGISGGTINTGQLSSYVNGGIGGGVGYNNATAAGTGTYPNSFTGGNLYARSSLLCDGPMIARGSFQCPSLTVGGYVASWKEVELSNGTKIRYLGR